MEEIILPCPKHLFGRVIGKNGKNISEIRSTFNVSIHLNDEIEVIIMRGLIENARQAELAIKRLIDPPLKHSMTCKAYLCSHLIGPRGSTISRIQSSSNTWISIDAGDEQTRIEIRANRQQDIDIAVGYIQQVIDNYSSPDYEGSRGTSLRDHCQQLKRERQLIFEQADREFEIGNQEQGFALLKQAKLLTEQILKGGDQAAHEIILHNNQDMDLHRLDLHGLHLDEALKALDHRINLLKQRNDLNHQPRQLHLITGAGHHSKNESSILGVNINRILTERGWIFDDVGNGAFVIHY